ncbi:MAG: hypothetical protein HWN79_02815 [Candidatus Lokiarchaeota archaeon]|nr:hypothetical protein [Candidatus Lokiarchaeota archaeon]
METSQKSQNYEQVVEKIVFDEEELEQLKIIIKNFTEGKIEAKQLKQNLLLCRGRIVKDISNFLSFCIDRIKREEITSEDEKSAKEDNFNKIDSQIQQDLLNKNELLRVVANKVSNIVENLKKD